MPEPDIWSDIREIEARSRQEAQMREMRRRALEGMRRLGAPQDSTPSVSPEIRPGIYWEDIGVMMAAMRRKKRKNRYGMPPVRPGYGVPYA